MMSFKVSASGGTPEFYAGLATDIGNPNNFPSYSEHSYFQIWDNGYAYLWEVGNVSSSKTTLSTTNRSHRYTIIYTGTSLKFYLDNVLKATISRNENLVHYAMFKFNPDHTSISEYDVHFEKVHSDYFIGEAGGGGSETFKTISVSGQDDIVADTATDTLTLSASGGISISTTAASDTINLSYGGAHSISPLDWTASSSTIPTAILQ